MAVVDSGQYDVVFGWLQPFIVDAFLAKGYNIEIVLFSEHIPYKELERRMIERGNNPYYIAGAAKYYADMRALYGNF